MHNITALNGGEVNCREPNAGAVAEAKKLLEQAESGEVTGVVVVRLHADNLGSYSIAGLVGPYSMLGAVDMAKRELQDSMLGQFE